MSQSRVPLVVLTHHQDNVESINSILRSSGQPAHCHWVREPGDLAAALDNELPELLYFFAEDFDVGIAQVNDVCCHNAPPIPLIVVAETTDEQAITAALTAGARDLVSTSNKERLNQVSAREIRSFRLERALNDTLSSATQYKKKLKAVMASAVDALAVIQEGILVDANDAWAEIFGSNSDDMLGQPVMDFFDTNCHTVLKGALSACQKGRWEADPLRLQALHQDGRTDGVEAWISASIHDGDPAIHVSIPMSAAAPVSKPAPADPLAVTALPEPTDYYQRAHFLKLLEDRMAGDRKSGVSVLAYLRPDRFGELKDEIGPLASEELLVQLAHLIRSIDQPTDLLGRFGGTDFTLCLERGTLRDVEAWAENALKVINSHIFEVADHSVSLTCTMGIAEAAPGTTDIDYLIRCAETALKRGRQRGGNEVVLEETSDKDTRTQRYDEIWVGHIKSALMDNRFRLLHLPIGSLSGDERVLFDTLVRMLDEQGNEVLPGEFMPAAVRRKLMKNIDRWVVGASFSYCASGKPGTFFVRLSAESITDQSLPAWLDQQLDQHRTPPDRFIFEVAETDATHHLKATKATAERLQAMGFGFAIEHFGLSRDPAQLLGHVAADYVKIDGSLMQGLSSNDTLQEKVRALVNMAKEKKIATIAERIEDANTMAVLFQLGVGYMQGHYLQEPEVVLQEA
jgi:diguanylate cyclase (GGDEF)-like protein/PAS domain S-box-containing protein